MLVALDREIGANIDVGTYVLELEVVGIRADLRYPQRALRVSGVGHALYAGGLVGVVTRAGDLEGLIHVPALGFLLDRLAHTVAEVVEDDEVIVEVAEVVEEETIFRVILGRTNLKRFITLPP